MDCSAYVSRAWGVDRYTTESIWQVASAIAKNDLRPGDALNLTIGRDPHRLGHIRIFEAWANAEHSIMWVFEETPPRAVHRVIVYDDRYQPIRLAGLSAAGVARVIPGTPVKVDERTARPRPASTRPSARPTPRPTPRPTARGTGAARVSPLPTPTVPAGATPAPEPRDRN
jgi:hypothetical protein